MSKLQKQQESSGRKGGGGPTLGFEKEGAAQVILVGPPNSGKSSILDGPHQCHTGYRGVSLQHPRDAAGDGAVRGYPDPTGRHTAGNT